MSDPVAAFLPRAPARCWFRGCWTRVGPGEAFCAEWRSRTTTRRTKFAM